MNVLIHAEWVNLAKPCYLSCAMHVYHWMFHCTLVFSGAVCCLTITIRLFGPYLSLWKKAFNIQFRIEYHFQVKLKY